MIDPTDIQNRRARTIKGSVGIGPSWDFKTEQALRMGIMGTFDVAYEPWMEDEYDITPTAIEVGVVLDLRFDAYTLSKR